MIRSNARRSVSVLPELIGIVALALLSLTPLVVSSGAEMLDWLFAHRPPDWSLLYFEPLVGLDAWLHWIARLLIGAGLVNVALRRVRPFASFCRRMAESPGQEPEPGTALHRLATRYECVSSVRVLPEWHGPVAFTTGIFRPRIYLSESVLRALDARETELLLLHELEHCRSHDPARSLFATVLADLFFWLPIVRELEDRVMSKIEFGADEAAASLDRAGLAQTILKVAGLGVAEMPAGAVPFGKRHGIVARVRRLIEVEEVVAGGMITTRNVTSTMMVLILLWTLGLTAYGTHRAHQDDVVQQLGRAALVVSGTSLGG